MVLGVLTRKKPIKSLKNTSIVLSCLSQTIASISPHDFRTDDNEFSGRHIVHRWLCESFEFFL